MKVGVFDSGVGGQSVVNAIRTSLPEIEVVYADDKDNIPYGDKTPDQLLQFTSPILNKLSNQDCDVIVIACNTVTTTIIDELRKRLPVPLIGMEPMIKPAAEMTKTGVITVCATPGTLNSDRYKLLKNQYAKAIKVIEPDCSKWAYMIETNQIDRQYVYDSIDSACSQGSDVVVLGCTHYHWIEDIITDVVAGRAIVLQPEQPVIQQIRRVLKLTS
jgi:glutamate racemase